MEQSNHNSRAIIIKPYTLYDENTNILTPSGEMEDERSPNFRQKMQPKHHEKLSDVFSLPLVLRP
jgi:hypothetical protein